MTPTAYHYRGQVYRPEALGYRMFPETTYTPLTLEADVMLDGVSQGRVEFRNITSWSLAGCFGETFGVEALLGKPAGHYKDAIDRLHLANMRVVSAFATVIAFPATHPARQRYRMNAIRDYVARHRATSRVEVTDRRRISRWLTSRRERERARRLSPLPQPPCSRLGRPDGELVGFASVLPRDDDAALMSSAGHPRTGASLALAGGRRPFHRRNRADEPCPRHSLCGQPRAAALVRPLHDERGDGALRTAVWEHIGV